ncbi:hypothetical protein HPP92_023927 [Vanilla planifolia]|uniref:30S ribosomal protein 3, chloroplastic n=1 Tax=Vanilla planifolia TaxID=51239 RepID=A0A835PML8_VANPL|nr:hypothetical protein HPP92_023927 [Vanilla planifolia]
MAAFVFVQASHLLPHSATRFLYEMPSRSTPSSPIPSPSFSRNTHPLSLVSHVVVPSFPHKHPSTAASAAAEALDSPFPSNNPDYSQEGERVSEGGMRKEKLKVVVKTVENPRLVLKFIWMEKSIGLALDQMIPGHGCVPLSPYYFWPGKDAWEELKIKLEQKPWISQKRIIILLNQATDIINLWQQAGGNI